MNIRNIIIGLALPPLAFGCLLDRELKHRGPTAPEDLHDGWEIDTPANVGLDPAKLAAIHDRLLDPDRNIATLGFLAIKDGKLVFETYLNRLADRDHYHHIMSVTKSVTSLVVGIARDRGWIGDLNVKFCDLFPDKCAGFGERIHAITLDNLLTMRSGIDFSNDLFAVEMTLGKPSDPIRHILGKPSFAAPGTEFNYQDSDPQLIAYSIRKLAGRTEQSIAHEFLFVPLGFSDYYWESLPDGTTEGAFGLHLRPRDLARLGQLMLDGGVWKGQRIVSQEWIDLATSFQVESTDAGLDYGYYWWLSAGEGCFAAWGHGGQFILVDPARRLVLVQIARPDIDDFDGSTLNDFFDLTRPLRQ